MRGLEAEVAISTSGKIELGVDILWLEIVCNDLYYIKKISGA